MTGAEAVGPMAGAQGWKDVEGGPKEEGGKQEIVKDIVEAQQEEQRDH